MVPPVEPGRDGSHFPSLEHQLLAARKTRKEPSQIVIALARCCAM